MNRNLLTLALLMGGLLSACASDSDSEADSNTGGNEAPGTDAGGETPDGSTTPDPEGDAGTEPEPERCVYPVNNGTVAFDEVIPDMAWEVAYDADGEIDGGFDLFEFHCNPAYDAYDTLIFVVSTEWCPYCPGMMEYVDLLGERLEQEGALVVIAEVQDRSGGPISSSRAAQIIEQYTPNGTGIRVGDADNFDPNALGSSRLIQAFPTTFAVRRDDMVVIADSSRSDYYLPFVEIAMDPEADWSNPGPPTIVPEVPLACGPEDEESFEGPNNRPEGAGLLSPGDTVEGGVCDPNPDYYRIETEGPWTARLEFTHADGDLDMYVWNLETDQPLAGPDGSAVGSDGTSDVEEFSYEGPVTLMVYGFRNASGKYTLTLTSP